MCACVPVCVHAHTRVAAEESNCEHQIKLIYTDKRRQ